MYYSYNQTTGIASVSNEDISANQTKVLTIVQQHGKPKASMNAYLGARYSRSDKSIEEIAAEVLENNTNSDKKIESIFHGYGHASVGDLANLFIQIENIPIIVASRFFYNNPLVSGQERSTRYQDFSKYKYPEFYPYLINDENLEVKKLAAEYNSIIQFQMKAYNNLFYPTKEYLAKKYDINTSDKSLNNNLEKRTFDCTRFLIPMGIHTNLCGSMSARNWAVEIARLSGSRQKVENDVAVLLKELLTDRNEGLKDLDYVPECPSLIKYTAPSTKSIKVNQMIDFVKWEDNSRYKISNPIQLDLNPFELFYYKLNKLIRAKHNSYNFKLESQHYLAEILAQEFDDKCPIGSLAQGGEINIQSSTDLGSLKDLNRHRSISKFIPLFEDIVDVNGELSIYPYKLCSYINVDSELYSIYVSYLDKIYDRIIKWYATSEGILKDYERLEYVRYMIPHAHNTEYIFGGDLDKFQYIINLRIRPGGHINYRQEVAGWLTLLKKNVFFKAMSNFLKFPDINSKEEFLDRK